MPPRSNLHLKSGGSIRQGKNIMLHQLELHILTIKLFNIISIDTYKKRLYSYYSLP